MNDILSVNRLWNYMKWNLMFTKRRYLHILISIPGIYFLLFLFSLIKENSFSSAMDSALPLIILIVPISWEQINNERDNDGKLLFTFPVSSFERFLSMWLRCVIIFPLLGVGMFFLLNFIFSFLPLIGKSDFSGIHPGILNDYRILYVWIGIQSITMVLTTSFRQKEQWKGTVIFMILFFIFISFSIFSFRMTGNEASPTGVFMTFGRIWPEWAVSTMKYYLLFLFPIGMWIVTFFKIREKEI